MAIERYSGDGGANAMLFKLREIYKFKKEVYTSGDDNSTSAELQLWLTDELYLKHKRYIGGGYDNYINMVSTSNDVSKQIVSPFANDTTRLWRVYKTSCGVAFQIDGNMLHYISDTITPDGKTSTGFIGGTISDSVITPYMFIDGMGSTALMPFVGANSSTYFTALSDATCLSSDVYFPHLKSIIFSPLTVDTTEQKIIVDGTTYIANKYFALEE